MELTSAQWHSRSKLPETHRPLAGISSLVEASHLGFWISPLVVVGLLIVHFPHLCHRMAHGYQQDQAELTAGLTFH